MKSMRVNTDNTDFTDAYARLDQLSSTWPVFPTKA